MASADPEFQTKAADIIALYLDSPAQAAVFCLDEKTATRGAGPAGSGLAAVASSRRAPRISVLPPRHALAVCRLHHQVRLSCGQDRGAAHRRGVRGLSHRYRRQSAQGQRPSSVTICRPTRPGRCAIFWPLIPTSTSPHAHLLLLAQPSRVVVQPSSAPGDRAARLLLSHTSHASSCAIFAITTKRPDPLSGCSPIELLLTQPLSAN